MRFVELCSACAGLLQRQRQQQLLGRRPQLLARPRQPHMRLGMRPSTKGTHPDTHAPDLGMSGSECPAMMAVPSAALCTSCRMCSQCQLKTLLMRLSCQSSVVSRYWQCCMRPSVDCHKAWHCCLGLLGMASQSTQRAGVCQYTAARVKPLQSS